MGPKHLCNKAKPKYKINPQHDKGRPPFEYNPRKDPLPRGQSGEDLAELAYRRAIPAPDGTWWARTENGQFYRYSASSNGETYFNGIFDANVAKGFVHDDTTWMRLLGW